VLPVLFGYVAKSNQYQPLFKNYSYHVLTIVIIFVLRDVSIKFVPVSAGAKRFKALLTPSIPVVFGPN